MSRPTLDSEATAISNLSKHMGTSTDRMVNTGNLVIKNLEIAALAQRDAVEKLENAAVSQSRQQTALILMSLVVALATVAYMFITWQSVDAMREANEIQRESNRIQLEATTWTNAVGEPDLP